MRVAWWTRGTPPRAVTIAWWMPRAPTWGLGMVMSWWRETSRRAAAARAAAGFPAPTPPGMTVIWRVAVAEACRPADCGWGARAARGPAGVWRVRRRRPEPKSPGAESVA